jgi:hypothetical protein
MNINSGAIKAVPKLTLSQILKNIILQAISLQAASASLAVYQSIISWQAEVDP